MRVWALMSRTTFRIIAMATMAVLTVSVVSTADDLVERDRAAGVTHLEKTRDAVLGSIRDLSPEQLRFKQSPKRWCVMEVVEHLALTEEFLFGIASGAVMQSPPGDPKRNLAEGDKRVLETIADRSSRATAPAEVSPSGKMPAQQASEQFAKARARILQFLKDTPGLRGHVMDSPIGPLDAYQWLLLISAHSERHWKQIEEVKADPRFPAK